MGDRAAQVVAHQHSEINKKGGKMREREVREPLIIVTAPWVTQWAGNNKTLVIYRSNWDAIVQPGVLVATTWLSLPGEKKNKRSSACVRLFESVRLGSQWCVCSQKYVGVS